jgi:predicted nucleic acid-binding protein
LANVIEHGVLLAERNHPSKGEILRKWLDGSVLPAFSDRILDVDPPIALQAVGLHVPNPASFRDALIGATAIVHAMAVVARNAGDFEGFARLELVNPWT